MTEMPMNIAANGAKARRRQDVPSAAHQHRAAPVIGAVAAICAGCAAGSAGGGYGVDFYEPFNNSEAWGPAYLVGPPQRYPNEHGRETPGNRPGGLPASGRSAAPHATPTLPPAAPGAGANRGSEASAP